MKIRIVKMLIVSMSFCLMLSLAACGGDKEGGPVSGAMDRAETLVYGAEFEGDVLNPILYSNYADALIFRGLMTTDADCKVKNDIASDVKISPDKLIYTISIKNDVKFHDGTNLTVDDVVFTLKSIMNDKVNSAKRTDFIEVKTVEKIDDSTLKITLKQQFPPLLDKLTVGIVPEHAFEGQDINKADFNRNPIGCGPYKFVKWESGTALTMTAFGDYYGNKAKIKNVIFKYLPDYNTRGIQLKSGELDLTFLEPSQVEEIEKNPSTTVYKIDTADYRCVNFNFATTDLFKDARVRQALSYSTNKQSIVDTIAHGYGYVAYTPLQFNKYATDAVAKYDYNIEKAKSLLDEAGWIMGQDGIRVKDGKPLSFTLTAPVSDEVRVNIANALASEWKKIGVAVKVDALDWSAIDIFKCDAFVLGFGSPFDADTDTYPMFCSTENKAPGQNYGSYSNKSVDNALKSARVAGSDAERQKYYADFQKAVTEDPSFDLICYLQGLYGATTKLQGLSEEKTLGHHGFGVFWNIEDWEFTR